MSARIAKRQRDGSIIEQLFGDATCYLSRSDDETALSFQGVISIFKDLISKVNNTVTRSLNDKRRVSRTRDIQGTMRTR
jgi:hypothetical protein